MHSIRIQLLCLAPPSVLAMMTFPLIVTGLLLIFISVRTVDRAYQVHRYIVEHQALVEDRLRNPKVHMFSLSQDLDELRVTIDVEDRETFDSVEHDMVNDWKTMEFLNTWDIRARSGEELGNNWGVATQGVGLALSGFWLILVGLPILAVMSFVMIGLIYWWLRQGGLQAGRDGY